MQANLNVMPRVVQSSMTSRVRDFVRMNPPIFLVAKVNEDPHEFIDRVYKVYSAMGLHIRRRRIRFVPIEGCFLNLVHSMEG